MFTNRNIKQQVVRLYWQGEFSKYDFLETEHMHK